MEISKTPSNLNKESNNSSIGKNPSATPNPIKKDLKSINSFFRSIYEKREVDYFEKKIREGQSKTPFIHFLKTYCNCLLEDLVSYKKIKNNSDKNYYILITKTDFILSKDYEDTCNIDFCTSKNPVVLKTGIENIQNISTKTEENKFTLTVSVSSDSESKGNIM